MSEREWAEEDRQAAAFYGGLLRQHGDGARALNWGSRESQMARFRVLAAIGDLKDCSVLDVGCGLGDLWPFLRERGVREYAGIDVSGDMVARARELHPGARFEIGNACDAYPDPGQFDYVFASGIFYLHQREPAAYLRQAVGRMFGACRRGVAFNSLSGWAAAREPGEFYADPLQTLDDCRRITPWVSLRHDYHPGDFTIHLFRDRSGA